MGHQVEADLYRFEGMKKVPSGSCLWSGNRGLEYLYVVDESSREHSIPTDALLRLVREHFEDALTFCRNGGYRPELAWTSCDYADCLLQRDAPSDREKAMSLLDESLPISTELGMRPLMERGLSRRDILKA